MNAHNTDDFDCANADYGNVDPQEVLFESTANSPFRWRDTARVYTCAANQLVASYRRFLANETEWTDDSDLLLQSISAIMLLFAIASENLLKGLRVAQGPAATAKGKLARQLSSHTQTKFADEAGFELSPAERELLVRFQDFVESGKYPTGKDPNRGWGARAARVHNDVEEAWALLQRLDDAVTAELQSGDTIDVRTLCQAGGAASPGPADEP